jgi:hypothetical protein
LYRYVARRVLDDLALGEKELAYQQLTLALIGGAVCKLSLVSTLEPEK